VRELGQLRLDLVAGLGRLEATVLPELAQAHEQLRAPEPDARLEIRLGARARVYKGWLDLTP
jgi:hypothetical protein